MVRRFGWRALLLGTLATTLASCSHQPAPTAPAPPPSQLTIVASPSTVLLSGSDTTLTLQLRDPSGTAVSGATVSLATTAGTLSASTIETNEAGFASAILTSDHDATVTAWWGTALVGRVSVNAVAPFQVHLGSSDLIRAGTPTLISGRAVPIGPARVPPTSWAFSCGPTAEVTVWSATAECTFATAGTYTVDLNARTPNSWTAGETITVTVKDRATITPGVLDVAVSTLTRTDETFTVQLTVQPGGAGRYRWDFGNGDRLITSADTVTYVYYDVGAGVEFPRYPVQDNTLLVVRATALDEWNTPLGTGTVSFVLEYDN